MITYYSDVAKCKLTAQEKKYYEDWDRNNQYLKDLFPDVLYLNGDSLKKEVAITFDDAPDAFCTPEILNILRKKHVKANFSVIGKHIIGNEALVKQIYHENHMIVNHTYSHIDLSIATNQEIYNELQITEDMICNLIGIRTAIMRPPYGKLSKYAVKHIAGLDYKIVLWSYNTCDWVATSRDDILDGMTRKSRPGEIILLHSYENKEFTVNSLECIIDSLREKGFKFVTLDEMLSLDSYRLQ